MIRSQLVMIICFGLIFSLCAVSFAGTPFSYEQKYDDENAWRKDLFKLEDTGGEKETQWADLHGGAVGADPAGTSLTLIYLFNFPAGIETLEITHELITWEHFAGDRAKMFTSFNGKKWTLQYEMVLDAKWVVDKESYGDEFRGRDWLFLKFYFLNASGSRGNVENASIAYLKVEGTMQKDIPDFDNEIIAHEYAVKTQGKLTTTWANIKRQW